LSYEALGYQCNINEVAIDKLSINSLNLGGVYKSKKVLKITLISQTYVLLNSQRFLVSNETLEN